MPKPQISSSITLQPSNQNWPWFTQTIFITHRIIYQKRVSFFFNLGLLKPLPTQTIASSWRHHVDQPQPIAVPTGCHSYSYSLYSPWTTHQNLVQYTRATRRWQTEVPDTESTSSSRSWVSTSMQVWQEDRVHHTKNEKPAESIQHLPRQQFVQGHLLSPIRHQI
jgi:hypothetical protein